MKLERMPVSKSAARKLSFMVRRPIRLHGTMHHVNKQLQGKAPSVNFLMVHAKSSAPFAALGRCNNEYLSVAALCHILSLRRFSHELCSSRNHRSASRTCLSKPV